MNVQTLKKAINSVSDNMAANKDYLVQLDQQNGDGDLGISIAAGFKAVSDYLLASGEEKDLGRLFMKCGAAFNEVAPSSWGTILSMGMMGMARALKAKKKPIPPSWPPLWKPGLLPSWERPNLNPGKKPFSTPFAPE
jgi:hypothetical protein